MYTYRYIHIYILFHILFNYGFLQYIEYVPCAIGSIVVPNRTLLFLYFY